MLSPQSILNTHLPYFLIIGMFFLHPMICLTQNFDIKITESVNAHGTNTPRSVIKIDDGDLYFYNVSVSVNGSTSYLLKVNADMTIDDKIEFGVPFKDCTSTDIISFDDKDYWFVQCIDKQNKKINSLVLHLDESFKTKDVITIDTKPYHESHDQPYQTLRFSQDSSKIMMINSFDLDKKKRNFKTDFLVLDREFNIINEFTYSTNFNQKQQDIISAQVTNDGSIIWCSKTYRNNNKRESRKGKPDYFITVNKVEPGAEMQEVEINTSGKFCRSAIISEIATGEVFLICLSSEKKDNLCKELTISRFDKEFNKLSEESRPFNHEENTSFASYSKKPGLPEDFYFTSYVWYDDSVLQVYLERNYAKGIRNGVVYRTESGILLTIDKSGKFTDFIHIPKRSNVGFPFGAGALIGKVKGKDYFIYNDHPKNLSKGIEDYNDYKVSTYQGDSEVVIAYRDEHNDIIRTSIKNDDGYTFIPKYSRQVSSNQFALIFFNPGMMKVRYKYALITIN